jgi:hypothetical protein
VADPADQRLVRQAGKSFRDVRSGHVRGDPPRDLARDMHFEAFAQSTQYREPNVKSFTTFGCLDRVKIGTITPIEIVADSTRSSFGGHARR